MSSSISNADAEKQRKAQRTLLTILAVCIAPFLAATIAFNFFPTSGRVNYGDLLEPVPLPEAGLGGLKGKWIMLSFDNGTCDQACQAKLFNMRQSRTAQGREMGRVERLWIRLDEIQPSAQIAPLYEGMHVVGKPNPQFMASFPPADEVQKHVYLVDPLGNLMLRFPADADPKRMIKDLHRLLKVSRVG
jgi:hypothetical protein